MKRSQDFKALKKLAATGTENGVLAALAHTPGMQPLFVMLKGAKTIKDVYKSVEDWKPDPDQVNNIWKYLSVNPESSVILDDKIEKLFQKLFMKKIDSAPDDTPLPDIDEELKNFLKSKFNGTYIKKD